MQLDHASNGQVRTGYPFSVACKTNGSDKLKVQWFKDGSPVVSTNALRPIAVTLQPADLRGFSTVYLEIKKATVSDRGEYECRAKDWGQTVRKTVFLDVVTPPVLDLMPLNPTVFPVTSHSFSLPVHQFFIYIPYGRCVSCRHQSFNDEVMCAFVIVIVVIIQFD